MSPTKKDNIMNYESIHKLHACSVANLLIINKNSIAANYDCTMNFPNSEKRMISLVKSACRLNMIEYSKFAEVIVTPMTTHEFKAGVPCEEHYRCMIDFCDRLGHRQTLDISDEDFQKYCATSGRLLSDIRVNGVYRGRQPSKKFEIGY
jgi:hypothetical protein